MVVEYETAFIELSRYAAPLVADEDKKCKKFLDGLNPPIKARVWMFHINTFFKLVHVATEAKAIEQRVANSRQDKEKRSAFSYLLGASWF